MIEDLIVRMTFPYSLLFGIPVFFLDGVLGTFVTKLSIFGNANVDRDSPVGVTFTFEKRKAVAPLAGKNRESVQLGEPQK